MSAHIPLPGLPSFSALGDVLRLAALSDDPALAADAAHALRAMSRRAVRTAGLPAPTKPQRCRRCPSGTAAGGEHCRACVAFLGRMGVGS